MSDMLKRGILEHAEALARGEYSAEELTRAYLDRIERIDPEIGAFLTLDGDRAIAAARDSDARRASGTLRGDLDGIPIAVKDNICTAGLRTSCASKILENYIPPYSATAVERLCRAGALIIGKTNMDEFGMGSSGENSAFGITRNPNDTSRVVGGSSSGSAAAVAANEVPAALGSDTGGSVRLPASFCGCVGMKPTYGRVSRYGLIAFASSLDQIGVISSNVRDNAALLEVISGCDFKDSTTAEADKRFGVDIGRGAAGLRIGILSELISVCSPDVRDALLASAEKYREMGAEIRELSLSGGEYALGAYYIISSAEASSNLARFDGVRYGRRAKDCESIEELFIRSRSEGFGDEVKRRIMLGTFALSAGYGEEYYIRARKTAARICSSFSELFAECDLLLMPTSPSTAHRIGERRSSPTEAYAGDICTVSASLAGLPAISLPCGRDSDRLPIGVQLVGARFSERLIYRAAAALEEGRYE